METNLVSLITTLTISAIVASYPISALRDTMIATKARATSENLRLIEQAKRQFYDLNGREPAEEEVAAFFPGGELPKPLRSGEAYGNITSLTEVASSSFNGKPGCEPWGNFGPVDRNGFNDLGNARPIRDTRFARLIYVQPPPPSTICDLPVTQTVR